MNKISRLIYTSSVLACSLVAVASSCPVLSAPQVHVVRVNSDEDAIKAQLSALRAAVAEGQPATVAALWTPDGTYIDQNGMRFVGRAELEKRYQNVFRAVGKVLVDIKPEQITFLAPTVATASGLVTPPGGSTPETRFSMIMVKKDGKWWIASATETPFAKMQNIQHLSSLDWLIGDWATERNGGKVRMKADWIGDGNFIQCRYEINKPGQATQIDYQVIGWDPKEEEITSWTFGAAGGCIYGHWRHENNNWIVESHGTAADGSKLYARNVISVTDPNNFSWQSQNRKAGGIALGDTEPLTITRSGKQSASTR